MKTQNLILAVLAVASIFGASQNSMAQRFERGSHGIPRDEDGSYYLNQGVQVKGQFSFSVSKRVCVEKIIIGGVENPEAFAGAFYLIESQEAVDYICRSKGFDSGAVLAAANAKNKENRIVYTGNGLGVGKHKGTVTSMQCYRKTAPECYEENN